MIAEIDEDSLKLYDGGYQSKTTKSRLNALLMNSDYLGTGEQVFQKNFDMVVRSMNIQRMQTEVPSGMRLA